MGKENLIPIVKRIINKLPEPMRTYALLQLIGRKAADIHGWTNTRLYNAIGFTRALVDKALKDNFFPDEWALALETSIASGEDTCFPDAPELTRRKRMSNVIGGGDDE